MYWWVFFCFCKVLHLELVPDECITEWLMSSQLNTKIRAVRIWWFTGNGRLCTNINADNGKG